MWRELFSRSLAAAARRILVVHLLAPGNWTVWRGHRLAGGVERQVHEALPLTNIVAHLEPSADLPSAPAET